MLIQEIPTYLEIFFLMQTNSVKFYHLSKVWICPINRKYTFFFLSWFTKNVSEIEIEYIVWKLLTGRLNLNHQTPILSKLLAEKQEIEEEMLGILIFHHLIWSHTPAAATTWKLTDH